MAHPVVHYQIADREDPREVGTKVNSLFLQLAGAGRRPLSLLDGSQAVGREGLEESAPDIVVRRIVPNGRRPHVRPVEGRSNKARATSESRPIKPTLIKRQHRLTTP